MFKPASQQVNSLLAMRAKTSCKRMFTVGYLRKVAVLIQFATPVERTLSSFSLFKKIMLLMLIRSIFRAWILQLFARVFLDH